MVPFIIRIPENEYELYKELAREKRLSLAEFFRRSVRRTARLSNKKNAKYSIFSIGTKIVSKGGPKDGSVNADKYYYEYEDKKRRLR